MARYRLNKRKGVHDTVEDVSIPEDIKNRYWRKYQEWLSQGGVPDPYVAPVATPIPDSAQVDMVFAGPQGRLLKKMFLKLINEIRTNNGQDTINMTQFETWVKARINDQ